MNVRTAHVFFLLFPCFVTLPFWAQAPAPHVDDAAARAPKKAAPRVAPASQRLFGTFPIATNSLEARKFVELALDKYENALLEDAEVQAQHSVEKDPQFALGYAVLSYAARRGTPNADAQKRAKALLPRATPDEQLMVRFMTSAQDGDLLPAISAMNDLLKRFPKDKHVLYLTAEWLYYQQDYDRSRKMMEFAHEIDPDFPPVLNMLGYAYVETGDPQPAKAVACLKRYAEVFPGSPNPEDSLAEVLRYSGDDQGSLEHYTAALQLDPNFISSQIGLGDTSTLMGDYERARAEYDRAIKIAMDPRDRMHAEFQKAMVNFWEGRSEEGRKALEAVVAKAIEVKEPYAQFEASLTKAMLAANFHSELEQLDALADWLKAPTSGFGESDRSGARAALLRERVRVVSLNGQVDKTVDDVAQLEKFAALSRNLIVENDYECSRGYVLFAKGDFRGAAEELGVDIENPLVVRQFIQAQEKLGNTAAAEAARKRLNFLRAPTVQWYLVTHEAATASN
jgi:predicted Zn-dependent protease